MPTVDLVAQGNEDVERIARSLYLAIGHNNWEALSDELRHKYRHAVRTMLMFDVIRVGKRPDTGEPQIEGQLEIEALQILCHHVWAVGHDACQLCGASFEEVSPHPDDD